MLSPTPPTFTTKLGKTRAGESSRLWVEGPRLIALGMYPGLNFEKDVDPLKRTLYLYPITEAQFAEWPPELRGTVSGKNGKPIIDIVGARVMDCFQCKFVEVTYELGRITITAA